MKKRLISAWLALRGVIDYESIAQAQAEANALAKMLHQQDQDLWTMSQQPSWERMRPYFAQMMEHVNDRKVIENERIKTILIPELNRTYGR